MFVHGGSDRKAGNMCVGGINFKSVGNDSGLVVVSCVLLLVITVLAPMASMLVSDISGKCVGMFTIIGKWVGGKCSRQCLRLEPWMGVSGMYVGCQTKTIQY